MAKQTRAELNAPYSINWETEFWVRDPGPHIPIAFEQGIENYVFNGKIHAYPSFRQDFRRFLSHARGRPWRAIWTSPDFTIAVEHRSDVGLNRHTAVWPIWSPARDDWDVLERLIDNPWSERPQETRGVLAIGRNSADAMPVTARRDQEHRILISALPRSEHKWRYINTKILRYANQSDALFHFNGQKSVDRCIGVHVQAFDHPVKVEWKDGVPMILLPNGIRVFADQITHDVQAWLRIIGIQRSDFKNKTREELSNLAYDTNLRSLKWAMLNYDNAWDFRRGGYATDADSSDQEWEPPATRIKVRRSLKDSLLDRWMCDTCTKRFRCPFSRKGSVCIVPDSEASSLARLFKTRSSASIIEGLQVLMAANATRAEAAMSKELDGDKLDPEVTRILNSLFDRGVTLAKLVDPALAGRMAPKMNILNVGSLTTGIGGAAAPMTPARLMSGAVAELESRGHRPEDITPAMVEDLLVSVCPSEDDGIFDAELVEDDEPLEGKHDRDDDDDLPF